MEEHLQDCIVPDCVKEISTLCLSLIRVYGSDPDAIIAVMAAMEKVSASLAAAAMHGMVEDSASKLEKILGDISKEYVKNVRYYYEHPSLRITLLPKEAPS